MRFTTVTIAITVNNTMDYKAVICDANHLYEAYLKSIQNSKWKETTQKFMLNYLRQIFLLQKELETMEYKPGQEGMFTLRERGKIRPITSLQPRDRIVRHILCDYILMPEVRKKLIYDNGSSLPGKGISFANKRFKAHLRKFYMTHGNNQGYILFGDFRKFYDNIRHDIAKDQLLQLVDYDEYIEWLLNLIFDNFRIDVSYMSDREFEGCLENMFDKLSHRQTQKIETDLPKLMEKSVNIGDQLSQIIGVYYPTRIDNYVKTVRSQKYYGRYMDDWYIMGSDKDELLDIYDNIKCIAADLGIFLNEKKTYIAKMGSTYKYLQIKYSLTETGKVIERINPKRMTAMRTKLKKLASQVREGTLEYENVEGMFRSWMGSYYKLMSNAQRNGLLRLFGELYLKSISVCRGKLVITDRTV